MNKSKKWIRYRHKIVTRIVYALLYPYTRFKYGIKIDKFLKQENRQYLVLYNHQTAFDQFFVGMAFKGAIYYVASEDLFSNGIISKLIKYLVAPIPIKKSTTDVRAVINCMQVAREGGTIAIAPEGNRTYSGTTVHIKSSISSLAKALKLPIAIFRIEGGYGAHPRWSDVVRRGKMRAGVRKIIEPEDIASLSDDELYNLIKGELWVDETESSGVYKHKRAAEYLERAIYICPKCGFSEFFSSFSDIQCLKCGTSAKYTENLSFAPKSCGFGFSNVKEWYDYQDHYITSTDPFDFSNSPIYEESADVYSVTPYVSKRRLAKKAILKLYGTKLVIQSSAYRDELCFDAVSSMSVLGRNKLNIYTNDKRILQIKPGKRFNSVKYMNMYFHYTNVIKGVKDGEFLGI